MTALDLKFSRTCRGFKLIEFADLYGQSCSLQQSSLAEDDAIWLGANEVTTHPPTGCTSNTRMHLNRDQAAELVRLLQSFVETGDLPNA